MIIETSHQQEWKEIKRSLDSLKNKIKEEGVNNENWNEIRKGFTRIWSKERIEKMTIEEYTNIDRDYSFTYWIENELKDMGDIHGATSIKFGIYRLASKRPKNYKGDDDYAWRKDLGNDRDNAFKKMKEYILRIIKLAEEGELEKIDNEKGISDMFKWKIAFLYEINSSITPIFSLEKLEYTTENNFKDSHYKFYSKIKNDFLLGDSDTTYGFMIANYWLLGGILYEIHSQSEKLNFNKLYNENNGLLYWDNKNKDKWKKDTVFVIKNEMTLYYGKIEEEAIDYKDSWKIKDEEKYKNRKFVKVHINHKVDLNEDILSDYNQIKWRKGQSSFEYFNYERHLDIIEIINRHNDDSFHAGGLDSFNTISGNWENDLEKVIQKIDAQLEGKNRIIVERYYSQLCRNQKIVALVKKRESSICQICGYSGFEKEDGTLFAEVHHIHGVAKGGSDTSTNLVCVCANCHRKLHYAKQAVRNELINKIIK